MANISCLESQERKFLPRLREFQRLLLLKLTNLGSEKSPRIFERLEEELNSSLDSEEASGDEEIVDSSLSPPKGSGDGYAIDCCEVKEEGVGEIVDSSRSPLKESDVDQRNGGISDEDNGSVVDGYEGEEEEEMEERGGCVRGVLKLLFTLIACLLLTSYMFPMNSPTDSTTLSGVVIKNETVEFVSMGLSGNGFFEVGDGGGSNVEEAGVEMGSYCESDESTEDQIVEYLEWNDNVESVDNSIEEANYGENDESVEAEIAEYSEWDEKEMFENENVDGEDAQFEGVRGARFEFRVDESEHLLDVKNDENAEGGIVLDMKVVSSYAGLDGDSLYKDEVTETENLVSPETVESEDDSSNLLEPIFEETPVESKDTDETGSLEGNANPVLLPSIDRKVEFLPRASLPSHSMREAPRELSRHIHAPTVELIGEIVVGQPRNSETVETMLLHCLGRVAHTLKWLLRRLSHLQSSFIHLSVPLQVEALLLKERPQRKRGQIREAMIVPTPVRRSSRLRNRPAVNVSMNLRQLARFLSETAPSVVSAI
ncbi:hypothetical protein SASPL_141891 [Salvia splendens]|uniref:Uncharacterized protein n=1 Tax=Salvia splendens TaxID=180675 RepID=A0A8X8WIW4_SALSN|nr:hypothetical protein SASPL_141891 [Salvia splendens]